MSEFEWDKKKWNAFVKKIESKVSKDQVDRTLTGVAYKGLKEMVAAMPSKTGALRQSWKVLKKGQGEYAIVSLSKVALFLEAGTKAHGPKTAKFLYIPLRPNAAVWREGLVLGKDYILTKRVKGITAMHYLRPVANRTLNIMVDDFHVQLKKVA